MMASINPLGERARGNRWWRTAAAFTAGCLLGGWGLGAATGAAGGLVALVAAHDDVAVVLAAALILAAGLAELAAWPVPTVRRQVDQAWLGRYRGWVYGAGYGLQLGAGLTTTVTTSAVYAMVGLCVLLGASGRPSWAHAVGVIFGVARAGPVLAGARLRDPARIRRRATWAAEAASTSRLATGSSLCALAVWSAVSR